MNVDAFIKGVQRANSSRGQRQGRQQDTKAVTSEPVLTKHTPVLVDASAFDLEHYRVELIAKAIAHINNKQRK
ncbi:MULTISPECIES: hypothetical protein [Pseudomonas]|uniref:hypothetical protein n=1 Tax=Pseudomonas TaxID=286 RepID=UPI0013CE8353|nr:MULTISPECIES: hypothetical protein [Pseudomonas]MCE0875848.1 hypothetical protein [Pseudomonas monteilii]MCE0928667.1 hypothetical protein [Pseudomonas monteilii]MCE0934189.1 hypothetical protein [Pseudomonas monteilii]MCE0979927.1 hypothetical protein [Pseudomonas monteilii]MCE1014660.1 hypothetical protein [Pseudomonas monteilii]